MKESMYIRDMVIRKQHEVWPPRPRPQRKKTEAAKRSRGDEVEGKKKSELRRSLRITASLHSSRCAAPSASTASEEEKKPRPPPFALGSPVSTSNWGYKSNTNITSQRAITDTSQNVSIFTTFQMERYFFCTKKVNRGTGVEKSNFLALYQV